MPVFGVDVGVALVRPPRTQQYRRVLVEAETGVEAELIACQIAGCTSVMATESVVTDWMRDDAVQTHALIKEAL